MFIKNKHDAMEEFLGIWLYKPRKTNQHPPKFNTRFPMPNIMARKKQDGGGGDEGEELVKLLHHGLGGARSSLFLEAGSDQSDDYRLEHIENRGCQE